MHRFTFFQFLTNALFFSIFFVGSCGFAQAQVLHSATDSIAPIVSAPGQDSMGMGFRFSPTQTLFVDKLGKIVPESGTYSWTIWDVATKKKLNQQGSLINNPTQYVYENVASQTNLILRSGKEYILELYYRDTASFYYGLNQMGQHLIIYETRMCHNCDINTFPMEVATGPLVGIPDFLYSLLPLKRGMNDAAVLSIDSLSSFCSGTKDIYATIGNYGHNQIDSVEIHWEFNRVPQPVVVHRQLLDTLEGTNSSTIQVLLGSKSFAPGEKATIKVWTANPNGTTDTVAYGDTLEVDRQAQLNGNFTIDSSLAIGNGNYHSFSDLAMDLNTVGICGSVSVTVAPGIYHDFLHLKEIPGSSATNTITIDGQDSSTVLLTHDGSSTFATVSLEGTDYLTIQNLGIEATDTSEAAAIVLAEGADHNAILNNELKVNNISTADLYNVLFSGSITRYYAGANANYNIIANNKVEGGYYGIRMVGRSSLIGLNNKILNNEISNVYSYGICAQYQDSLMIHGNGIDVTTRKYPYSRSVYIDQASDASISKNYLNGSTEFNIFTSEISNNMIISKRSISPCVYLMGDSINVFHNSISTSVISAALQISASKLDIRNNIFSAEHGPALSTELPISIFNRLDNNIYYTKGENLARINGLNYPNFNSFQNSFPSYNTASMEGDPQFLSPDSNLHLAGTLANNAGDNSTGIFYDIEGDVRPAMGSVNVDIGADEFDSPSCTPPSGMATFNPSMDSVSLSWKTGLGSSFQYEVVLKDSVLGTGLPIITSRDSVRIGNLQASTGYDFYLRQICGGGDTSMWWGPTEFYTADSISYFENFEQFNNSGLTNGWTEKSSNPIGAFWLSSTSTYNGGPKEDHGMGTGGTFVYLYTTYFSAGISNLLSPPVYVDSSATNIEFSFWYHTYQMGNLDVFVDTNGVSNFIARISGPQQNGPTDPWLEFSTYLSGYAGKYIQLRFKGVKGTGYNSSIAIDDISLDTVPSINAGVVELASPQGGICVGTFTPVVSLQNLGKITIDSVKVLWEINGVLSDSVMHTGTILPGTLLLFH